MPHLHPIVVTLPRNHAKTCAPLFSRLFLPENRMMAYRLGLAGGRTPQDLVNGATHTEVGEAGRLVEVNQEATPRLRNFILGRSFLMSDPEGQNSILGFHLNALPFFDNASGVPGHHTRESVTCAFITRTFHDKEDNLLFRKIGSLSEKTAATRPLGALPEEDECQVFAILPHLSLSTHSLVNTWEAVPRALSLWACAHGQAARMAPPIPIAL